MIKIAAYSNRIYKRKLKNKHLEKMLIRCNSVKIKIYSQIIRGKLALDKLNTTYVIKNYDINTFYANMIIRDVKAVIKSQQEQQELHIESFTSKIEAQKEKVSSLEQRLEYWRNMKKKVVSHMKKPVNETIFPYTFKDNTVVFRNKEETLAEFEAYAAQRIRQLKSNIYNAKRKLNRLNQKLANAKKKPPVVCFGTKAFFKKQFTVKQYTNNHQIWKNNFFTKRYSHFTISGNASSIGGSMCVRYDQSEQTLTIKDCEQGIVPEGNTYAKATEFTIPCQFLYHEKEYFDALNKSQPIAYEIIDEGEYFIIKAVFDYEYENKDEIITSCLEGVNSIDINIDRYAVTELDKHGNLIDRNVVNFDLDGLTSEQATKVLEKAAIEVAELCGKNGKPLVREDISKIKFKDAGDAKRNKELTQFAYDKMITTIDRRCYKDGVEVYTVNPAYTSKQGKIKYMARLGFSIHESAAFCIGRRFLFSKRDNEGKITKLYYEDLGEYKKFGKIKKVSECFKKLSISNVYKLKKLPIKLESFKKLNKYIEAVNEYVYSQRTEAAK